MDVTAHGPAAQAGLKVGDVITAVNGNPSTAIPVYKLRRMLRDGKPGTEVRFTVKRGGHSRTVRATLRDQI